MDKLKQEFLNLNPVMRQYSPSTLEIQWEWINKNFTANDSIRVENRVMPNEVVAAGKPKLKNTNGLSFYIAIGSWGKPRISWDRGLRICLGFIAISIIGFDIENLIENADSYIVWLKKKCKAA